MGQETLVFRRGGFSPPLSLLMSAFALVIPPADFSVHLQQLTQRSPTQRASHKPLNYTPVFDCVGRLTHCVGRLIGCFARRR